MLKKILGKLSFIYKNYYIVVTVVFAVWMLFFDNNNLIARMKYRRQLGDLVEQKQYLQKEIDRNKALTIELTSNVQNLEKYARETYLMKKKNETIYLIIRDSTEKK
ncbi:MAG: septum formation initiator family protein [Bacteroidota bacterium]